MRLGLVKALGSCYEECEERDRGYCGHCAISAPFSVAGLLSPRASGKRTLEACYCDSESDRRHEACPWCVRLPVVSRRCLRDATDIGRWLLINGGDGLLCYVRTAVQKEVRDNAWQIGVVTDNIEVARSVSEGSC